MKSYIFQIELEPDAEGWRAFYPPLEDIGASTWGTSQEEALANIKEVLEMIVEEFNYQNQLIPDNKRMIKSDGAAVTVNL
ncbi:MAG: hypothetical protein BZY75_00790 [SAR202 cluster bacterium Io17-Chloro-G7]|nr:MAG: hypothetical protein BZY75_00790 [SAR202 cluster bacterium Io17-Chloro-G7]